MFKNTAGQKIEMFAFDSATGLPKTGDAANITVYVAKDFGATTALADTGATEKDATNDKGTYIFDVSQAESNADNLRFSGKSTTSGIVIVPVSLCVLPPNFGATVISSAGTIGIQSNIKKNQALSAFQFLMTLVGTLAPATGKTVTVTRLIDSGSFAAGTLSAVTEVGAGYYRVDFGAGDLNGNCITLRATEASCNDTTVSIVTQP